MERTLKEELLEQYKGMQQYSFYQAKMEPLESKISRLMRDINELQMRLDKEQNQLVNMDKENIRTKLWKVRGIYEKRKNKEILEETGEELILVEKIDELDNLMQQKEQLQKKLEKCACCKNQYRKLREKRLEQIHEEDSEIKYEVLECEEKILEAERTSDQIAEGMQAGTKVIVAADNLLSSIEDEEELGVWDLFRGNTVKNHPDMQQLILKVKQNLQLFQMELNNMDIDIKVQWCMEGNDQFDEFIYAGFLEGSKVAAGVEEAVNSIRKLKDQVEVVMENLNLFLLAVLAKKEEYKQQLEKRILEE